MLHRLLALLLFVSFALSLPAQGLRPYNPTSTTNAVLLGLGGTLSTTSVLLDRRIIPLTEDDVVVLDFDNIPAIDRYSTRHLSLKADEWTDKLLLASFASPFFLLLDRDGRNNFNESAFIIFQGALINSGLINLSKVMVRRPRPFNYNPDAPADLKLEKGSRFSFFSGHSATSAYFAISSAKIYSDLNPGSKAEPYVWATAAAIPLAVSYGRMRAGKHFFTDTLVGCLVGTGIALLVPSLHKRSTD